MEDINYYKNALKSLLLFYNSREDLGKYFKSEQIKELSENELTFRLAEFPPAVRTELYTNNQGRSYAAYTVSAEDNFNHISILRWNEDRNDIPYNSLISTMPTNADILGRVYKKFYLIARNIARDEALEELIQERASEKLFAYCLEEPKE